MHTCLAYRYRYSYQISREVAIQCKFHFLGNNETQFLILIRLTLKTKKEAVTLRQLVLHL